MATPTQNQPYAYPTPASEPRATPSQASSQFDKYCIIHIATTCDEHGVYVTKDSAEVIEIGWVVVDAKDPSLPEVCIPGYLLERCGHLDFHHEVDRSRRDNGYLLTPAAATPPVRAGPPYKHSHHPAVHLPDHPHLGACQAGWQLP